MRAADRLCTMPEDNLYDANRATQLSDHGRILPHS